MLGARNARAFTNDETALKKFSLPLRRRSGQALEWARELFDHTVRRAWVHESLQDESNFMEPAVTPVFNRHGVWAIYKFEMARALRTLLQSVVTPVITTSLYFVVFGAAIGSRVREVDGVAYGAFIVPGLIMLSLFTQSISNASFGIYFPKFTGTIYELLSAPVSYAETVLAYVGAAATKSVLLGLIILTTASGFVPIQIRHPFWMIAFLVLTAASFSLFGFIIGV